MADFSHLDAAGRAKMVDVGAKPITNRQATASALVRMLETTAKRIQSLEIDKGDVLSTARLAGIQAAKRTSELIPLCHQLPLDDVHIEFEFVGADCLKVVGTTRCHARTGVEMEAMVAVSCAALTVYDMCKAVDREIVVERVQLDAKQGGEAAIFGAPTKRNKQAQPETHWKAINEPRH